MRIPPSVIVMSLVTAVPFGLGIHDTLTKKEAVAADHEYDFSGKRSAAERARALAEYEAEQRRELAERERARAERIAKLDTLFGHEPAMLGSLFDGIVIGAGAGSFQPENVRRRIERASRDGVFHVYFDVDATSLRAVNVALHDDHDDGDLCEQMRDKLVAAWDEPSSGTWIDPATHQRASLDDTEHCVLRFDRYIDPHDWVSALPVEAIGKPSEKLLETLGPRAEADEESVYWTLPGLRHGKQETRLEAYISRGRIIGFKATVDADFDSTVAVREALAATLKAQPKRDEETGIWDWKRKVPVSLDPFARDRFSVMVGKTPWDN